MTYQWFPGSYPPFGAPYQHGCTCGICQALFGLTTTTTTTTNTLTYVPKHRKPGSAQ